MEEYKWEIMPPIIQPHGLGCHSVFMEGKFIMHIVVGHTYHT
jgi:hypothetical protein